MKLNRSISIKLFAYALCGLAVYILIHNLSGNQGSELNSLADDFKAANQADNIDSMLELYCLDGIDRFSIKRLKGALKYELGLPIQKIEFEPLSGAPEETIEFTRNGVVYGPTLKPRYRMRVTYMDKDRFTSLFTIGKDSSGTWKIITAKPQLPSRY